MAAHLIDQLPRPIIFGHRGASKYAPENTLAAFKTAFDQAAPAIELDVMLSGDEKLVIIHNQAVDHTTDGSGKVNEMLLSDLKKLDAGAKFSSKYKGERIPTLDEVFDLTKGKYLVNIELKNYHSRQDNLVAKAVDLVLQRNMQNSVIFSSFLPANIKKVGQFLPDVPAALLTLEGIIGWLEKSPLFRFLSPHFIHPNYNIIDEGFIIREHANHRQVNVWTVNEELEIRRFIAAGVDGIITDDPKLAMKILNESKV